MKRELMMLLWFLLAYGVLSSFINGLLSYYHCPEGIRGLVADFIDKWAIAARKESPQTWKLPGWESKSPIDDKASELEEAIK